MVRNVLGVIAGYVIFAANAVLWFQLNGRPPHDDAPVAFDALTLVYGVFFAALGGYLMQTMVVRHTLVMNFILAAVIFAGALASLLFAGGSHWTQWMTLIAFAPASIGGGYLKLAQKRRSA